MPEEIADGGENRDIEGMVSAEEVASYGLRAKLQDLQRIREDCGKAAPSTVVFVIDLAS